MLWKVCSWVCVVYKSRSQDNGVYANTTSTKARTSSENITSRFCNYFLVTFKVITFEKCVLTIRELNWNQRFRDKKTKLNIFLSPYGHVVQAAAKHASG